MAWFPRPATDADVELLEPSDGWTARAAHALLTDPEGEEWRHKVGVTGPVDGSAKTTTRLLLVRGWVLKTQIDQGAPTAAAAARALLDARARGLPAQVWHPAKRWAVMRVEDAWYPLTMCPALHTLRTLARFEERCRGWSDMIQLALEVRRAHR